MTNTETQIELNEIIKDINTILSVPMSFVVKFRPCVSQLTVFESDIILEDSVCIDKCEKHQKTLIIERTIDACNRMIDTLKVHVSKLGNI